MNGNNNDGLFAHTSIYIYAYVYVHISMIILIYEHIYI
jgi:hypothetical protein